MKRWLLRLLPLWGMLLAAAGWFGWGAMESRAFDERLAALRAEGDFPRTSELESPPVSTGSNGWEDLRAAHDMARAVDQERAEGDEGYSRPYTRNDGEPREAEDLASLADLIPRLGPYYAQLEKALKADVLDARPQGGSGSHDAIVIVHNTLDLLQLLAEHDATRRLWVADQAVRLLSRWVASEEGERWLRALHWATAITLMRAVIVRGTDVSSARPRWLAALRAQDVSTLEAARSVYHFEIASRLEVLLAWRRGEEPHAAERMEAAESDRFGSLEDLSFDMALAGASRGAPRPFSATFLGRPLLHGQGVAWMESWRLARPSAWTEAALRTKVDELASAPAGTPSSRMQVVYRSLLGAMSRVRLARVALGDGDASREDPLSGQPFERVPDGEGFAWRPPLSTTLKSVAYAELGDATTPAEVAAVWRDALWHAGLWWPAGR